ncbi:4-alpha-glucanotransferase [Mycobacterium tuberculosis CAS/NITR204]|uniref:4-alpha-glucanotransferase n=1 Tax=Mycobacterium tuberculosis CAS/NITR204 TaxID=1310114 RepID=R4MIF2_MYCTX|nr:4-alpha-glucanotransferase [Mycobacterium tuberculosis CAS/NITR204]
MTPDWLGLPDKLAGRRAWGLAVQLYSVRSRQSWGIGDLTDLANLALWSASAHGAGYVLVNPLHAATLPGPAGRSKPIEPSPYLPTSRRFVNPLYLRVEAIPELVDLPKRGRVQRLRTNVQQHADQLDTIDRDSAWAAKRAALKLVHRRAAVGGSRAGLRRLPYPRGPRPRRLRHLVRAGRDVRR